MNITFIPQNIPFRNLASPITFLKVGEKPTIQCLRSRFAHLGCRFFYSKIRGKKKVNFFKKNSQKKIVEFCAPNNLFLNMQWGENSPFLVPFPWLRQFLTIYTEVRESSHDNRKKPDCFFIRPY